MNSGAAHRPVLLSLGSNREMLSMDVEVSRVYRLPTGSIDRPRRVKDLI